MAKRVRNIDITTWAEYIDVWCDFEIRDQIKAIEGVARVEQEYAPGHYHVYYDARYNLDDIVKEMRELANNNAVLSAGNE